MCGWTRASTSRHGSPEPMAAFFKNPFRSERLSPITRRRLAVFTANRRARVSLWVFLALFVVSLGAELIANDKPLVMRYDGQWYVPLLVDYPETEFGGFLPTTADYHDPFVQAQLAEHGWALWRSEEHTSELQSRPHLVCRL